MRLNPFFGRFGGQFVPEALMPALDQLETAFVEAKDDPAFRAELADLLANYAGRPTPLTQMIGFRRLSDEPSGDRSP